MPIMAIDKTMKQDLKRLISLAFQEAKIKSLEHERQQEPNLKLIHAQRSRYWIERLAENLLLTTLHDRPGDEEYLAFYRSKEYDENGLKQRQIFGLNEFLFDVVVGKMVDIPTASTQPNLQSVYLTLKGIEKAIWIVESEFQFKNSRALLLDINKLAVSKAKNKLFIISLDENSRINEWAKDVIKKLMKGDDANVYLASVPHPKNWLIQDQILLEEII